MIKSTQDPTEAQFPDNKRVGSLFIDRQLRLRCSRLLKWIAIRLNYTYDFTDTDIKTSPILNPQLFDDMKTTKYGLWLWVLLGLFLFRVLAQLAQAITHNLRYAHGVEKNVKQSIIYGQESMMMIIAVNAMNTLSGHNQKETWTINVTFTSVWDGAAGLL